MNEIGRAGTIDRTVGRCATEAPKRMPQIRDAFERLNCAISRMEKSSHMLADRIGPILNNSVRPCCEKECQPPSSEVELAAMAHALAERIEIINRFMDDTENRIEL